MANTVTSNTGAVVGNVVTFKTQRVQKELFLYVDYTLGDGTSATVKIGAVHPSIHASNPYEDTVFATAVMAPVTATFSASGKHRFKIPMCPGETQLKVTVTFADGATQAFVIDAYLN